MRPDFLELTRVLRVLKGVVFCVLMLAAHAAAAEDTLYKISVKVTATDAGHPTGSLVQAKDQSGRVRFSAGIERSYNTDSQSDPKQLLVSFDDGAMPVESETFQGPKSVHHGSLYRLGDHTFFTDSFSEKIYERIEAQNEWAAVSSKRVIDLYCRADAELCATLSSSCGRLMDVNTTVLRMRYCVAVDGRLVWLGRDFTDFAGVLARNLAPVYASDDALILAHIADEKAGTGVVICRLNPAGLPN